LRKKQGLRAKKSLESWRRCWRRAGAGAPSAVGLEKDGVKVLGVETEEKDDKLFVIIKAEVDGAAGSTRLPSTARKTARSVFSFM
jgi:hypothetical protein